MGYVVKQADPEKDKQIMIDILARNRNRSDLDYARRIDWIYLNNPFGRAKAWIIWEDTKNIPVGFTGVFPRPVFVQGKEYLAWNCGDFSIEKKYRTLGVAVKLRKEAKMAVDSGEVPFLYAHPNERMEVIHLRVGHQKISQMVRFALPLKVERYLKDKISPQALAKILAWPVDSFFKVKFALKRAKGAQGTFREQVVCKAEHGHLFEAMKTQFPVVGTRSVKYLEWKFARHPNFHYRQYDFVADGRLRGTIFFLEKNNVLHLIDVLCDDFNRYGLPMLATFVSDVYRQRPATALSFIIQEHNTLISALQAIGFKRRDDATSAVIAYANAEQNPTLAPLVLNPNNWFMTVGDRDA
jgi:hypothetical protein